MMDNNQLDGVSYLLTQRWKKVTAAIMAPILAMTFTAPTMASIRANQTIQQLEDHLSAAARYQLNTQMDEHLRQYRAQLSQSGPRESLSDLIYKRYPNSLKEKWVPIMSDSITFFVLDRMTDARRAALTHHENLVKTTTMIGGGDVQHEIIRLQLKQLIQSSQFSALGFDSFEQLQAAYYGNALTYMQRSGHRLGDNLTQHEINNIPYDMIWPEKRQLANNKHVFVPFVYLTQRTLDQHKNACVKPAAQTPKLYQFGKESLQRAITRGMSELARETRENGSYFHERFSSPLSQITDGLADFYQQSIADNRIRFANYDCKTGEPEVPDYIGSAYIQRDLIVQQLNRLLNRSYLVAPKAYQHFDAMAKDLYQNAFAYLQSGQLVFGQKLTQAQIQSLPQDMIWPEFETLANGAKVLIPRLYLTQQTFNANRVNGTTFSLGDGTLTATDFSNKGGNVVAIRNALIKTRGNFTNDRGYLTAKEGITLEIGGLLSNLSGKIEGRDVHLTAYALKNQTLVYRFDNPYGFNEQAQRLATIQSFGDLNITTAGDVLSIGGQFSSQSALRVNAGGSVRLLTAQVRHEDAQSGDGWSQSSQSLTNIQTRLSAVDLLSIVAKQTIVSQGSILESDGTLELLAGEGIHLLAALDSESWQKMFEASGSGVFGSSESREESEQRSKVVSTLLKAGYDLVLATEAGPVQLRATHLTSHGLTRVTGDTIDLELELEKYFYSKAESFESALSVGQKGNGISQETAHMSQFRAQGGLILDARNGITVELPRNPNQAHLDHHALIDQLATNDGLSWIKDIRDSHPDAKWEEIDLVLEEWDYEQTGLTPAAMAILAIAMTVATGGAGVGGLAGFTASAGPVSAAMAAGINALAMQATASLLANGGDISDTFDQLTSSQSVTSLATSMITAGVMQGLDLNFVSDGLNSAGVNEMVVDIAQQSVNSIFSSVVAIQVNSVLSGEGLSGIDDFDDMVVNAVVTSAIATVGEKLANKISEAKKGENPISTASGYIAHAALGCALGAARQTAFGGDSDSNASGCSSGAAGAVIGEFTAELYRSNTDFEEKLALLESESRDFSDKFLNDMNNPEIDPQSYAYRKQLKDDLLKLQKMGGDIGRLVAGITLFATGANHNNIDHAMFAAGNSAENNAFFIPALIVAFNALTLTLLAKSIKETVETVSDIIENPENLTEELVEAKVKEFLVDKLIEMGLDHVLKLGPLKRGRDAILEAIEDWSSADVLDKVIDHTKTDSQLSTQLDQLEQLRDRVKDRSSHVRDPNVHVDVPNSIDYQELSTQTNVLPQVLENIVQTPKGQRPNPSTYLSQSQIDEHLSLFEGGVTKFVTKTNYDKYGIAQRDGTSFVLPKTEADALLKSTGGNPRALEEALGLPENFLDGNTLLRVNVANPKELNLRVPSGNEAGANDLWLPGGKLPNGNREAIIDAEDIKPENLSVKELLFEK